MDFRLVLHPVESFGHEVSAAVFFEQLALHHVDAGIEGHCVVRHLHASVSARGAELFVLHPVEFDEVVVESLGNAGLSTPDFFRFPVYGNQGFCSRAPCGCADFQDGLHGFFAVGFEVRKERLLSR